MSLRDLLRASAKKDERESAAQDLAHQAGTLPRLVHPASRLIIREVERFAAEECQSATQRIVAWSLGMRIAEAISGKLEDDVAAAIAEWMREIAGGPDEATVPIVHAAQLAVRVEAGEWKEQ